jgi:hypothetical protein
LEISFLDIENVDAFKSKTYRISAVYLYLFQNEKLKTVARQVTESISRSERRQLRR